MSSAAPTRRQMAFYGLMAMPLAFAGLPLYVHLPTYYADTHGVSLALLGMLLLGLRIFDTVQDPLIGLWSDKARSRRKLMAFALPFLALGMFGVFNYAPIMPPLLWLGLCLMVTFTAFSIIQINLYAWGTELAPAGQQQTRIAAWREGFLFFGIMLAAVLPHALSDSDTPDYSSFGLSALLMIGVLGAVSLLGGREAQRRATSLHWRDMLALLRHHDIRWLLGFYGMSALASAIPATLYLFFIKDIIGAPEQGGYLLLAYFVSGVVGMPFWAWLAGRIGRRRTLYTSFGLMTLCFVWAFTLSAGDIGVFYIITLATGFALGADLALPAAMYADMLKRINTSASAGFGLWNFVAKLTLSLAAGLSLPLLAMAGYDPSATTHGENTQFWLSFSYALLPCALKLGALVILICSPLEPHRKDYT